MNEPQAFASAIAIVLERNPGTRLQPILTGLLDARNTNQARRRAVLEHADLRRRLERDLGYARADQWNGYIPPATINEFSTDELCRSSKIMRNGEMTSRYNQLGRYAIGEQPNDSPRRPILLEISAEAWQRRTNDEPKPG